MATAFQCDAFQNSGFQVECKKKKHGEATYYPVFFQHSRKQEEELILALFIAERNSARRRSKMRIV
jgi:hypothetical protein